MIEMLRLQSTSDRGFVMVQYILTTGADWLQALAAVGIVILTLLTLHVLREYASDTKRIAQASVKQTENSQLPFLAVFFQPNTAVDQEGWTVANQGSGPAINISWGTVQGGRLIYRIPSFAAGAKLNIHKE